MKILRLEELTNSREAAKRFVSRHGFSRAGELMGSRIRRRHPEGPRFLVDPGFSRGRRSRGAESLL